MKSINKVIKKGFIYTVALFLFFNTCIFSYVEQNGSGTGYGENPPKTVGISNVSIEMLIIEGAGYFFKAKSDIQSFLNAIEWQDTTDINYTALNKTITNSIINVKRARLSYESLVMIAAATPYNPVVIGQLKEFDYDYFRSVYNLNPYIFAAVKGYLVRGDITGTYRYTLNRLKEIEQMLLTIQADISVNRLPEVSLCWNINEYCAETSLFGSYIARIFKYLK